MVAPVIFVPFNLHWYVGEVPQFTGVAVKVTLVPAHTGFAEAVTLAVTATGVVPAIKIVLEVAGEPTAHCMTDVITVRI